MKTRVLLTGFGPFAGVDINPTEVLIQRIASLDFPGIELNTQVLEVSYRRSSEQVKTLVHATKPELVIHMGVARSTPYLRGETQAVNLKASDLPDMDGERGLGNSVDSHDEPGTVRHSHYDVLGLVSAFEQEGFPAQLSQDAGRYVCNAVYYQSLRMLEHTDVNCFFLHVPAVDAFWTIERQLRAIVFMLTRLGKTGPSHAIS